MTKLQEIGIAGEDALPFNFAQGRLPAVGTTALHGLGLHIAAEFLGKLFHFLQLFGNVFGQKSPLRSCCRSGYRDTLNADSSAAS